MQPQEIASREFPVAMRGYVKEEVAAFLAGVAALVAERDVRLGNLQGEVARLESQLADCRQRLAAPPVAQLDRASLMHQLGSEAATILACADASAERMRAAAAGSAERVRSDLAHIGASLADVHGFVGELVAMVADLTTSAADVGLAPTEIRLTDPVPGAIGGGATAEIRTVLSEVLGLDDGSRHGGIHLPTSGVG